MVHMSPEGALCDIEMYLEYDLEVFSARPTERVWFSRFHRGDLFDRKNKIEY